LGHSVGLGLAIAPAVAGVAITADGKKLLVANFENDSVSEIDIGGRKVLGELDLRPGKINSAQSGVPGGEYPFWVSIKGNGKAYVSSIRDREVDVLDITSATPALLSRIPMRGQPNKSILNKGQTQLYVANDVTDSVAVIDTGADKVIAEFSTIAPGKVFPNPKGFTGADPNSLSLSPDEKTLYVTNGGTNSVAVVHLASGGSPAISGLIPTGWYPNSVSLSADGSTLYVVNGKSNAGPNPQACKDANGVATNNFRPCSAANQYVWQLTKAGFSVIPVPTDAQLDELTDQTAQNNLFKSSFGSDERSSRTAHLDESLREKIKHVIYVVKENRTYDQVLGDLEVGNGDPSIVVFPEPISPNHHQLARQFVTLDNFYDSGEVSGDGWNWSTQARTVDSIEKTEPVNYAGRGLNYDYEGALRNINVGYATVAQRQAANPVNPSDPDLLPGTSDVSSADGIDGEVGAGYLWDAALRKGLSVRNYGFFLDLTRYRLPTANPAFIPLTANDPNQGSPLGSTVVAFPTKQPLRAITDKYFRGFDDQFPDFWRMREWQREFAQYVKSGKLPQLEFVRIMNDHFGSFGTAVDGVNTITKQMADNDYALGALVDTVAHSPFADSTLIFVIEDDCQDGPDHVDAHRSIAYVIGPHVKQGQVISTRYTTVNLLRTIEDVLGITPLNLNDGLARPMADVFEEPGEEGNHSHRGGIGAGLGTKRAADEDQPPLWTYDAIVPDVLRTTSLPLPATSAKAAPKNPSRQMAYAEPLDDVAWLAEQTRGMDFSVEDHVDAARFNRIVWAAMKGHDVPYPTKRDGRDLRHNRASLLGASKPVGQHAQTIDNIHGQS